MRKIIWIVILVILIVLFAIIMIDHNPPIIMLQFGSKTYSTKFLNVVLVALVCLIILYFIISIFKMIFKFPGKVKDSIGLKRDLPSPNCTTPSKKQKVDESVVSFWV